MSDSERAVSSSDSVGTSSRIWDTYDPWAVALGNASLLGIGHLIMRRWTAAVGTVGVSAGLVAITVNSDQPAWFWRALLVLWWVATIGFGWHAAAGAWVKQPLVIRGQTPQVRRHRTVALIGAASMLIAVLGLGADTIRLTVTAQNAHRAGDCDRSVDTFDRASAMHRLVDPLLADRAAANAEACRLLAQALKLEVTDPVKAAAALVTYLKGPSPLWTQAHDRRADLLLAAAEKRLSVGARGSERDLKDGIKLLIQVLDEFPARRGDVAAVLNAYRADLSVANPCAVLTNLQWVLGQEFSHPELQSLRPEFEPRVPLQMLACAERDLSVGNAVHAETVLTDLLRDYPDHEVAATAEQQLVVARDLRGQQALIAALEGAPPWGVSTAESIDYCARPVAYEGAPPYTGPGPHRAVFFGPGQFVGALDPAWRATGFADAVLVICVYQPTRGRVIGSCDFIDSRDYWKGVEIFAADLRTVRYPVRVYEIHTGKLLSESVIEMSGGCPIDYLQPFPGDPPPFNEPPDATAPQFNPGSIRASIRRWIYP